MNTAHAEPGDELHGVAARSAAPAAFCGVRARGVPHMTCGFEPGPLTWPPDRGMISAFHARYMRSHGFRQKGRTLLQIAGRR